MAGKGTGTGAAAVPPAEEEWITHFAYLRSRGVARVRWSTAIEPGEAEAHIASLALEDPDGSSLPPALLCRGFSLLHRHGDACAPRGGEFLVDLASGLVAASPAPRRRR